MRAPLLVEIGCEEIPSRMIQGAAADLAERLCALLDGAGIARQQASHWGGTRRLAVRIDDVAPGEPDREEQVLGPPASAAFGPDGAPTGAALGFARKHGIDPALLAPIETQRGVYAGFRRRVGGRRLEEVVAQGLPRAVEGMSFPKTMRWSDGRHRWVRPVHWLLALHGGEPLRIDLFDVTAGTTSRGHRFLAPREVPISHPDGYAESLSTAFVIVSPEVRRSRVRDALRRAATQAGGEIVEDAALLEEVADLVEWPGVVTGAFDERFLALPREILVTTLRHHQKCFSVQRGTALLPRFLAVANTDRDPGGHVRRGNEWVVTGRLEDARFFWDEDRSRPLAERRPALDGVVFHDKLGTYGDKASRLAVLAARLAPLAGLAASDAARAARAAALAKVDLTTGLVGEFPELQGVVGGLLLDHGGEDAVVARAVAEHYRPAGAADAVPSGVVGAVVALADRLDTLVGCFAAGLVPTGSRDPLALRRAANGIVRIALETPPGGLPGWDTARAVELAEEAWSARAGFAPAREELLGFLRERLAFQLREAGCRADTVDAVLAAGAWRSPVDAARRARALDAARQQGDFATLATLHKRIRKILEQATARGESIGPERDDLPRDEVEVELARARLLAEIDVREPMARGDYTAALSRITALRDPVNRFFDAVLVMSGGPAQASRLGLLESLSQLFSAVADFSRLVVGEHDES